MSFDPEYVLPRLEILQKTKAFDEKTLTEFEHFLRTADDRELFRMSPLRYAATNNLRPNEAIDLFLQATHLNLLEFNWGLICPSCGAFLSTRVGLSWVNEPQDCSVCMIPDIKPSIDENVEVAFTVCPSARKIRFHDLEHLDFESDGLHVLFSSSIALYPEVHQTIHGSIFDSRRIEVDEKVEIAIEFEQTHYFIMIPATHCVAHIEVQDGSEEQDVAIEIVHDGYMLPNYNYVAPGDGTITLYNRGKNTLVVGLLKHPNLRPTPLEARPTPVPPLYVTSPYLTAKQLVTSQSFRDLFRAESIPVASGMEFKSITMLFTDIKGSTDMYERIGDMNAYTLVRDHFSLLRGIVAANGGSLIKTMGDAIMASFATPLDAIRAADTMHKQMRKFATSEKLSIKVGIHMGACIAVEQNNQLDFFGQTINIAARIQQLAGEEEIVISDAVYEAEHVPELIAQLNLQREKHETALKGVSGTTQIYRLKR